METLPATPQSETPDARRKRLTRERVRKHRERRAADAARAAERAAAAEREAAALLAPSAPPPERPARPGPVRERRRSASSADGGIAGFALCPGPGGGIDEWIGFGKDSHSSGFRAWLDERDAARADPATHVHAQASVRAGSVSSLGYDPQDAEDCARLARALIEWGDCTIPEDVLVSLLRANDPYARPQPLDLDALAPAYAAIPEDGKRLDPVSVWNGEYGSEQPAPEPYVTFSEDELAPVAP